MDSTLHPRAPRRSRAIRSTRARVLAATLVGSALLQSGCGDRASSANAVVVDTLPNGAVRTLSSAPVDSGRWSLELLHEIRPDEGTPGELMQPEDVAMSDDGLVLVVESGDPHIKVFDVEGQFLRRIGRGGEGPGEFRAGWIAVRGDTLLVQDPQVARASSFRISDGEYLLSRPTTCCYWAPLGVDGAGRAVMPANATPRDSTRGPADAYVRSTFGGVSTDTVYVWHRAQGGPDATWEVRNGEQLQMMVSVPFQPRDIQLVDPRGGFVTAWNGAYLLRVSSDGSDTVAVYGRPFTPVSVSGSEKNRIVEARIKDMTTRGAGASASVLRAAFSPTKIPDVRPPFERFAIDRLGRTWVRRSTPDTTAVVFDLFGNDRRWLDAVSVPQSLWTREQWSSEAWGRDRVAVPGEDDEGRPVIRVFAIRRATG